MSDEHQPLTQARAKELFNYDPDTGVFTRAITVSMTSREGDSVGRLRNKGRYMVVTADGVEWRLDRLAFLMMTGEVPPYGVDRHDRDPANNKWSNLFAYEPPVGADPERYRINTNPKRKAR